MVSVADRLKNLFPTLFLRSPAHAVMSRQYVIFEFTGRRSGRTYRTPIAYVRDGERLLASTDSPWWRNLEADPTVRLRLAGREVAGTATVFTDPAQAAPIIRRLVDTIPSYARLAHVAREGGRVSDDEILRVIADGRVAIAITLEEQR